jgi:hypothetical protein
MAKEIQLTQGQVAIVDDADYEWLSQWKWHVNSNGYANRTEHQSSKATTISMHRLITDAPKGMDVDHIDGNPLNNQRSNLRIATRTENQRNQRAVRGGSSQYKGVHIHRQTGKWEARIKVNRQGIYLGLHSSEIDAARAYDEAARKYFGEFAKTNF